MQEFLKNDDVDLVKADLKAANYDDEYIEDTLTRLQDSGLMKREATQIRQQLQGYIRKERNNQGRWCNWRVGRHSRFM